MAARPTALRPALLMREQRAVGGGEQGLDAVAVLGERRHAETHGERDGLPGGGEVDGVRHAGANGLGGRDGRVLAEAGQHDDELVPGVGDGERALGQRAADGGCHLLDDPAAVQMAVLVHDPLEAIEVHEDDREARPGGATLLHQAFEGLVEVARVVEPREAVVDGEELEGLGARAQRLLGLLARVVMSTTARRMRDRLSSWPGTTVAFSATARRLPRSVWSDVSRSSDATRPAATARRISGPARPSPTASASSRTASKAWSSRASSSSTSAAFQSVVRIMPRAAGQRVGIAGDLVQVAPRGEHLVEMRLQRRRVALEQRDGCGLEQHPVAALALAQRILRVLALGRVDAGGDDLAQPAGLVEHGTIPPRDPHALAVAAHVLVLVRQVVSRLAQEVVHQSGQVAPAGLGLRDDRADDRAAEQLAERVAEEVLAVLVQVEDAAFRIPEQDDAVQVRQQVALLRHGRGEAAHRLAQDGDLGAQPLDLGERIRGRRLRCHAPPGYRPRAPRGAMPRPGVGTARRTVLGVALLGAQVPVCAVEAGDVDVTAREGPLIPEVPVPEVRCGFLSGGASGRSQLFGYVFLPIAPCG